MNRFIKGLKQVFGIYEENNEYWVDFDDIIITAQFSENPPKYRKMEERFDYYNRTGDFEVPIVLKRDFTLCDGYTSYLIADAYGLDRVPAYFVD